MPKKTFCELLDEAIKDEKEAPKLYTKLGKLATHVRTKKVLSQIRDDEKRHKAFLLILRREHCPRNRF